MAHATNCSSNLGIGLEFSFSGYHNTIEFNSIPQLTDLIIVWINWNQLTSVGIDFNLTQIAEATKNMDYQIYVVPVSQLNPNLQTYIESHSSFATINWLPKIENKISQRVYGGYYRSEITHIIHEVGVKLIQMFSNTLIRGIILDFDNTLYPGVFAEDGHQISQSDIHRDLRHYLKKLSNQGVLLTGATKNNSSDVEIILSSDLLNPLVREDFVVIESGWSSKLESVSRIISGTNINELNLMFIDDNKRELAEIHRDFPNLLCLDGEKTEQLINLFDNAIIFESDNSPMRVKQRIFDLRARFNRTPKNDLVNEDDDLLSQFNTKIKSYQAISPNDRERASELFRKTNQFNFTFNRTIVDFPIDKALAPNNKSGRHIYVCELSDDISNSGIIAALVVNKLVDKVQIIELCISCRALGRGVEKYIVYSLLSAADIKPFEDVECNFVWNSKNLVAQSFAKLYFVGEDPIKLNYDSLELAVPNFRKFCKSQ